MQSFYSNIHDSLLKHRLPSDAECKIRLELARDRLNTRVECTVITSEARDLGSSRAHRLSPLQENTQIPRCARDDNYVLGLIRESPRESTDVVRTVCRHCDAGLLRLRKSKPMVHFGIRDRVSVGFGLWISPRCLALRSGRGYLVSRRRAALVASGKVTLRSTSYNFSALSGQQLSRFLRTTPADAGRALPNLRSALTRNAG